MMKNIPVTAFLTLSLMVLAVCVFAMTNARYQEIVGEAVMTTPITLY